MCKKVRIVRYPSLKKEKDIRKCSCVCSICVTRNIGRMKQKIRRIPTRERWELGRKKGGMEMG